MTYPPPSGGNPNGYPGGYYAAPQPPPGYPGAYGGPWAPPVAKPTDVFGRRIGAFFIDFAILAVIGFGMFFALATHEVQRSASAATSYCTRINNDTQDVCVNSGPDTFVLEAAELGAIALAGLGYLAVNHVLLTGLTGFSFGKALTGIRCVKASTGARCGVPRAALRTLLYIAPDGPFICIGLVGLITAATTNGHRRVGDFAAGTAVVHKNAVGRPALAPAYQAYAAPQYGYGAPAYPGQPSYPSYGYPPPAVPSQQAPTPASPPPGQWSSPPADAGLAWPSPEPTSEPTSVFDFEPTTTMQAAEFPAAGAPPPAEKKPGIDEPMWDSNRNTYIQWDPELNQWMQWSETDKQWTAIR